jgi:cytochrome P450
MFFPFNLYQFFNDPKDYLLQLQIKHGDPFPLAFPGATTIWLTGKPELAKAIFTAPSDSFKASEKNPVGALLGPEGLIMQSGKDHLKSRKEFTPYFSKSNLSPMSESIIDAFNELINPLEVAGKLDLQKISLDLSLKIILKFLFPHLNSEELKKAELETQKFLASYSASLLFIPQWVPGTWNIFNENKGDLDELFYNHFLVGTKEAIHNPLSALVDKSKDYVLDQMRTMIVAGHETSATSLCWSLHFIYKDQYLLNRLREELQDCTINNILQNSFLEAVVNESMRIHPPVPFITRKIINRPFFLGDKKFQIDDEIGVCLSLLHRESLVWENAQAFIPERFLTKKYSPYEFAPFGGGARRCIGAEFSHLELKILIAQFIKTLNGELKDINDPRSRVMQITIGPKSAVDLFYKKIN